jgi:hypothetical protein
VRVLQHSPSSARGSDGIAELPMSPRMPPGSSHSFGSCECGKLARKFFRFPAAPTPNSKQDMSSLTPAPRAPKDQGPSVGVLRAHGVTLAYHFLPTFGLRPRVRVAASASRPRSRPGASQPRADASGRRARAAPAVSHSLICGVRRWA